MALTRLARLSFPPKAIDFSTKSFAEDQAKSPKNVGFAPGSTCWSHALYRASSFWLLSSGWKLMKKITPSAEAPACSMNPGS